MYNTIMDMGAAPFNPLFSHQADRVQPRPYREWMELDLQILGTCDAAFRVQGSSRGCDEETMYCVAHEIDVFFNYDKLKEYIERF